MAVLISGEGLRQNFSTVFEQGLREINYNDFFFSLKVGNAFQRSVKEGYRKIIYRVIRKASGVYMHWETKEIYQGNCEYILKMLRKRSLSRKRIRC
jgi:hypothetical protein